MTGTGVFIGGREYVPKESFVSGVTLRALAEAYAIAWTNTVYDRLDDSQSNLMLRKVSDLLSEANKELKFKP